MSENKKRFQMPSSYTVLIIIIAIMAFLTWVIPAGKYDTNEAGNLIAGTYQTVDSNPQGIYDVFIAQQSTLPSLSLWSEVFLVS